jgi:hypothetical protein
MKALVAAFVLIGFFAGCDITVDAPPPADSTPAATPVAHSAPGSTTGPGAPAKGKPTPVPGDWLWKEYKNPLDPEKKKK